MCESPRVNIQWTNFQIRGRKFKSFNAVRKEEKACSNESMKSIWYIETWFTKAEGSPNITVVIINVKGLDYKIRK